MSRKSTPSNAKNGNVIKHDHYREAFARINAAIANEYFIEAIAIEEGIVSDRLTSHLSHFGKLPKQKHPSLKKLTEAWAKISKTSEERDLIEKIDKWRDARNHAVHGIVKCSNEKKDSVNAFLKEAKDSATKGLEIVNELKKWHGAEVRKSKKCSK